MAADVDVAAQKAQLETGRHLILDLLMQMSADLGAGDVQKEASSCGGFGVSIKWRLI